MKYDILILGSGGAALSAALSAKNSGASVLVASEVYPTRSQTCMAQGGINAVLPHISEDDISSHIQDTLRASGNLASEPFVRQLCSDAPDAVKWLESIGVPFSRTDEGNIAQRQLGGASGKRACYSQDYTGLKILHTLYDQCLKEGIAFLNEHFLLELCTGEGRIEGAILYDIRNGELKTIYAKSVILATGGYSAIYHGYTTNTYQSTGDGIAAALRIGAKISNMEFVQFHPTALKGSGVLISESARGAGGKLVTGEGKRFVNELKPRDVVSRAIWAEISKGKEVYLDIRHLGEAYIDENIPQERKLCLTYAGIDPVHELIPIAPVAHYSMGGIDVDAHMMSHVHGLYAVGECANAHVHGANRLGGNSLLEIVAFGRIAGRHAATQTQNETKTAAISDNHIRDYLNQLLQSEAKVNFYRQRTLLGEHFYTHAGIIRTKESLQQAEELLDTIERELPQAGLFDKGNTYNTNLIERIKFENSLLLAEAILKSAQKREESRGAHYRSDYPDPNPKYQKESVCMLEDNHIQVDFQEVRS